MFRKIIATIGATAALACLFATPGLAFNPGDFGKRIQRQGITPPQYIAFCRNNASDCKAGGKSTEKYTSDLRMTLEKVNSRVNRAIKPREETNDVWSVNVSQGDCEDYALTKRRQLIRAGVSPSALRMASVITQQGVGHAVLLVNTDRGQFVLQP